MTPVLRPPENLEKLLKLARGDLDTLRIDLADIVSARESAEQSLEKIDREAREEQPAQNSAGAADYAAYMDGLVARRHNLRTTLMTLTDAEQEVRDKLELAVVEMKKLEHLLEMNDVALKKVRSKQEKQATEDAVAMRQR